MIDPEYKDGKILIVDDQQVNIDILTDFLDIQGYLFVKSTTDSRKVIDLMIDFQPDIILLDLTMPYFSGFDILEQLKTIVPEGSYLPVLVLTADVTLETKRKALMAGASDFLTKPFDLIELKARVNTHLEIKFKNEQIKEYATRLEEVIATKNKFFSIIAHDLRNPFVGIENFVKIILQIDNYEKNEIEKHLQTISNTAHQGYELLENLLNWSKSQTGNISVINKNILLHKLINKCFTTLETQASNKDIVLKNQTDKKCTVFTDTNILETVLRNLITNAIKYTTLNGSVLVSVSEIGNSTEISVIDSGVGMDVNTIGNLFRMDINLQSRKGTANEKGSGLGLILCKEFIEKLGGTIRVESELNKGSTFTICLPIKVE